MVRSNDLATDATRLASQACNAAKQAQRTTPVCREAPGLFVQRQRAAEPMLTMTVMARNRSRTRSFCIRDHGGNPMKSSEYHRKQALTLLVMARATRDPKTASALAELPPSAP